MHLALLDWLWGYDFFISYAHADGRLVENGTVRSHYVHALAARLRELKFSVFHDETEYDPGTELSAATARRVRGSTKLLLVARPSAMVSSWVLLEVNEAIRSRNEVVVISINGAFEREPTNNLLRQAIGETRLRFAENLVDSDGDPSATLIGKLHSASQRSRRDRRRQRAIAAITILLAMLAGISVWQWRKAETRRLIAEGQRRFAQADSAFANARRLALIRDEQVQRLRKLSLLRTGPGTKVIEEEIAQAEAALVDSKQRIQEATASGLAVLRDATNCSRDLRRRGVVDLDDLESSVKAPSIFSVEMLRADSGGEATLIQYGRINQPRFILIDGGGMQPSSYLECVYPRLRQLTETWAANGALRLELVVASQWDAQRIRGIHSMLESLGAPSRKDYLSLKIETLWFNVYPRRMQNVAGRSYWKREIPLLADANQIPLRRYFKT